MFVLIAGGVLHFSGGEFIIAGPLVWKVVIRTGDCFSSFLVDVHLTMIGYICGFVCYLKTTCD